MIVLLVLLVPISWLNLIWKWKMLAMGPMD